MMLKSARAARNFSVLRRSGGVTFSPVPKTEHSTTPIFTDDFLSFLRTVSGDFLPGFRRLLSLRQEVRNKNTFEYRKDLEWIRDDVSWRGPQLVQKCRWVEITGPAGDAKMVINALNSGADCYMSDLEDSQSPTWLGIVSGWGNIINAAEGSLSFKTEGKEYAVGAEPATLLVRPRGIHLTEKHVIDDSGRHMPASIVDIAVILYHSAEALMKKGQTPHFYLPKLETFEEALLMHDVLQQCERLLGLPYGMCRATVLIETLAGCIQAEEIGFALGPYWAGLNVGRWDHLFSILKNRSDDPRGVFPDRHLLNMQLPLMTALCQRVVQVAHSRGVHAIGGMSAFLPGKDRELNEVITTKVIKDKEWEIVQGCDGAWVAHPGLVHIVRDVFRKNLHGAANQIECPTNLDVVIPASAFSESPWVNSTTKQKYDLNIEAFDDIGEMMHSGEDVGYPSETETELASLCTAEGLKSNVRVGVQYLGSWLGGKGAVSINGLMEDLATAEISRVQVWQWLKHKQSITYKCGSGSGSNRLSSNEFNRVLAEVLVELKADIKDSDARLMEEQHHHLSTAAELFKALVSSPELQPFITDTAVDVLNASVPKPEPLRTRFTAYKFEECELALLRGSRPDLTINANASLTAARGDQYRELIKRPRKDGLPAHANFIGTPSGHAARNVIEGGKGETFPYIGGWELNARGLNSSLEMPAPDTLSVSFFEQAQLARVINNTLKVADRVQHLKGHGTAVDFLTQPMMADLEQGWSDPKKAFYATLLCIENGVNIVHVEDQFHLKRCGHLGGKGLEDLHSYIVTLKSVNLAASLFPSLHRDGPQQNFCIVARTDALSAEIIQFSETMRSPGHPDHDFIDWCRGFTNDGRYLYLKKGTNPDTGRAFGLDHSATRCAEVVKLGLASHVWMETPDARIDEARAFIDLVNEKLASHGLFARGLYNHSPSFLWDVSFFAEAEALASSVCEYVQRLNEIPNQSFGHLQFLVRRFLKDNGDRSLGDFRMEDECVAQILANGLDAKRGPAEWRAQIDSMRNAIKNLAGPSLLSMKTLTELDRVEGLGFRPLRHITNSIVAQRLKNFKSQLTDSGFEILL